MLKYALIGFVLVAVTVIIHAVGTMSLTHQIGRRYADQDGEFRPKRPLLILVGTVLALLALHTLEIVVWAYAYWLLLPLGELSSLEETIYFSFITFTTLGYGDITLTEGWRLLGGIEALNGIILVGWSTAMLIAIVQRMLQGIVHRNPEEISPGATDE